MTFPQKCLATLGTVHTGSTPSTSDEQYWGGEIPFVTPSDLDQRLPVFKTPRTLTAEGGRQSRLIREGSIMVCCIGSLGKIGIAGQTLATNQQINSIEFDPQKVWAKFGYYACQTLKSQLVTMAPATTIAIVSKSKFSQLEIPVPPLPEQRRIAAILDQADELRAKRREALAQLDSLTQSIFIEMFGDPVNNPKSWGVETLGECAEKIQIGPFGTQLHEEDYIDGGIPLINPTHLRGGMISPDSSLTVSPVKYAELGNYYLLSGDLIMGRRGEMGRCAVITQREQGWLCGTGSLFVRPKTDVIHPIYLGFVISSPSMRRFLENVAQGVTMANLNKTIVGGLPIAVPPMANQLAFVSQLKATNAIKKHSLDSLIQLDTLFASLQHRAFQGEL